MALHPPAFRNRAQTVAHFARTANAVSITDLRARVVVRKDVNGNFYYDLEKGELPSVNPQVPEPSIEGTGGLATREAPTEEINPGNQPVNLDVASALNPAQLDNELSNAEQQLTRAEALNKALAQAVSCMLGQGGL